MALRALLLDLDDTLIDTRFAFEVAMGRAISTWLPHLSGPRRQAAIGHWLADRQGHFKAFTRGEIDFVTQRHLRVLDLHAEFEGPALSEDDFERWDRTYAADFTASWRLRPGAGLVLEWAESGGLRLGAITNMPSAIQRAKLLSVGLADRLPLLVTMDTFGVGKPDPRAFHEACRLLSVEPAEAAYVGDELDVDALGAAAAGLHGVWLRTPAPGVGDEVRAAASGVIVISSLAELPTALRGL